MARHNRATLRTIDLFAGAGGLTQGLHQVGGASPVFDPVFAVEIDQAAASSFKANFGSAQIHCGDIGDLAPDDLPDAEIVIGSPPCQGFSTLGRDIAQGRRSQLNSLWRRFVDVVGHVQPQAFLIENVPQFLRSAQFSLLRYAMESDPKLGHYELFHGVLNAADYGVPQVRKRGLVLGVSGGGGSWPPPPTHFVGTGLELGKRYRTVEDAIADLPPEPTTDRPSVLPNGRQDLHIRRNPTPLSLKRYRHIPAGGNRFDLPDELLPPCWRNKPTGTTDGMGRMWWDRPAPTIRTEFFKPEKGRYLHPEQDRAITHREAARLQTFPDEFIFEGSKIEIARQIGNAVPPVLGQAIGEALANAVLGTPQPNESV